MSIEAPNSDLIATAIRYRREIDLAPKIVAKGRGYLAKRIIDEAKANSVDIKQDSELSFLLALAQLDDYIPVEAYAIVAKVLASLPKREPISR
jgi:flagellar biosynthesis protein